MILLPLLLCSSTAQELPTNGVNGFSLHPPYFNLAEGTKIDATATCGVEEDTARPIQDLYCKLVGGPVFGDPSQTIQVRERNGWPHTGRPVHLHLRLRCNFARLCCLVCYYRR